MSRHTESAGNSGAALLQPGPADRLAPWLVGPLAALAGLALIFATLVFTTQVFAPSVAPSAAPGASVEAAVGAAAGRSPHADADADFDAAAPAIGDAAPGTQLWTLAMPPGSAAGAGSLDAAAPGSPDPTALALHLAAVPGVAAAVPVDPDEVSALTAMVVDGTGSETDPDGSGAVRPILVDLTVSAATELEARRLEARLRAALPGLLIARPPVAPPPQGEEAALPPPGEEVAPAPPSEEAAPAPPSEEAAAPAGPRGPGEPVPQVQPGAPVAAFAGLATAFAALILGGLVMTVVTRLSITDNARDIGLLRLLGAEEAMLAMLYQRAATRSGWIAGLSGSVLAIGLAAAWIAALAPGETGSGGTPGGSEASLAPALLAIAAALAVPPAMALISRLAAGRACRKALRAREPLAEP